MQDILERFMVPLGSALEVGTEHGHSAIALSNFFASVTCVDIWQQAITDQSRPMWDVVRENTKTYTNIVLLRQPWQQFTDSDNKQYDLCHYDGEHNYEQTYLCGCWMAEHSPIVLFHDVCNSFVGVVPAVRDIAEKYHRRFYRFEEGEGLGIVA